jgi:hypothetical protein
MRTRFVRTLFVLALIALIASAVFAETPRMIPYITKLAASPGAISPFAVAVDANNNIYFAGVVPAANVIVYKMDYATGAVTAFAGGTAKAVSPASTCATPDPNIPAPWTGDTQGDGCPANSVNFNTIRGLAVANGYLYISDYSSSNIRKIYLDPNNPATGRMYVHEVEPVVGGGSLGSAWNGDGARTSHTLKNPYGIAVDPVNGNVYWGDGGSSGYAVRMYDVATDSIVTVTKPGTATVAPTAGCQTAPNLSVATASLASVNNPYGLAFDGSGNLWFVDKNCYSVRKLTRTVATNKVDANSPFSTPIGTGATGTGSGSWYNTNGTPAYMAAVRSVAPAAGNDMYITDTKNVWYYDATTGWVHQFYGSAYSTSPGCTANPVAPYMGCPAANVQFAGSSGGAEVATDSWGNLFIADYGNQIIQEVMSGLDFVGTPNVTTTAPAVANAQVMVHGDNVTGLAGSGPFSAATATCSTYNAGDLEAECVVPATYTPSQNGIETGTFTSTGNTAATFNTQGLGAVASNHPPTCSDVGPVTVYMGVPQAITLNCSDPDPGETATLTYAIATVPPSGTLGAVSGNQVTFTPTAPGSGITFTYHATDIHGATSSPDATVIINVPVPTNPSVSLAASASSFPVNGGSAPVTMTATVVPGTNPASTGTTVIGDMSALGGSATQAFTDSGDGIHFTYSGTLSTAAKASVNLSVSVVDSQLRPATSNAVTLSVVGPAATASPVGGSGDGTFTFTYTDLNGASAINLVQGIFNSGLSYANACAFQYAPHTNNLFLYTGTGWGAAVHPGAGTLTNGQCTINSASVTSNGNELAVTLNISFKGSFVGNQQVWAYAADGFANSGWQNPGTWTTTAPVATPPTVGSIGTVSAGPARMALAYSSTNGGAYISWVQAIINGGVSYANGCAVHFVPGTGVLYLQNDAGTGFATSAKLGSSATLQNSQCAIDVANSTMSVSGNTMTLTLAVSGKAGFIGSQNVYGYAADMANLRSGWVQMGTWTPNATLAQAPAVVGIASVPGTTSVSFSDTNGGGYISWVQAVIAPGFGYAGGCTVYLASSHNLYLQNDAGTGWGAAKQIGQPGTLSNSQCTIDTGASSWVVNGNTATLNLAVTYTGFAGTTQKAWGYAVDNGGLKSQWVPLGSVTLQ